MPLTIRLEAPTVDAADVELFRADARLIFGVVSQSRARQHLAASHVTAVLADDFAASVERHYVARPGESPTPGWYNPDRQVGRAMAKVLEQTGDYGRATIVFDSGTWLGAAADPVQRLNAMGTLAHEFAHVVIDRARHVSGAMDGVVLPSITGHEAARSLARIAASEYRADIVEDVVREAVFTSFGAEVNGGPVPRGLTWLQRGNDYLGACLAVIEEAYPGWPDLVDRYRNYEIPLEEMFGRFCASFERLLTFVVHAQAHADHAGAGDVLDVPELAACQRGLMCTRGGVSDSGTCPTTLGTHAWNRSGRPRIRDRVESRSRCRSDCVGVSADCRRAWRLGSRVVELPLVSTREGARIDEAKEAKFIGGYQRLRARIRIRRRPAS